jgi:hypothetical protein
LEWSPIKELAWNPLFIRSAEGRAVKVTSLHLCHLPAAFEYRVVLMQRALDEVLRSQDKMLRRHGNAGDASEIPAMQRGFERHAREIYDWLIALAGSRVLRMSYPQVLREPREASRRIAAFLDAPLDIERMSRQVDRNLYRSRAEHAA